MERSATHWETLDSIIVSDDSLRAACQGDDYVHWACYPEDLSFLFRYNVPEDGEWEDEYPEISEDCDLCGPPTLIKAVKEAGPPDILPKLLLTNAKKHFDQIRAGRWEPGQDL